MTRQAVSPADRDAIVNDPARLAALDEYLILDTIPEPGFDDIVAVAGALCTTPVALVTFVAGERQWFKARTGTDLCETPIEQAICVHALGQHDVLVIPDLTADPRTRDNAIVTGDPRIRFYAGAPMVSPSGHVIGTVCVLDVVPRPAGLTAPQAAGLAALARQAMQQVEQRRSLESRAARGQAAMAILRERDRRWRNAQHAGRMGSFEVDVASQRITVSPEVCAIYGLAENETYPIAAFQALVFDDDREIASNAVRGDAGIADLDVEYRIRRADDGRIRWIARRAEFVRDSDGRVATMFGMVHDVTDRRVAGERMKALVDLGDRLRDAAAPADVALAAGEALGRTLGAGRAGFARIDLVRGVLTIERDWTAPGQSSLAGEHDLGLLAQSVARMRARQVAIASDIPAADWLGADRDLYARAGVRSVVTVPVFVRDALLGAFFVHSVEPRIWGSDELDFIYGIVNRAYATLAQLRAESDQAVLNQEISHRLKNLLAMVQAIANQTLRGVTEREPVATFDQRLLALGGAHDLLMQGSGAGASLAGIVELVIAALGMKECCDLAGPPVELGPRSTLSTSLLLHELATNALKYGALSVEEGRVTIDWAIARDGPEPVLTLAWSETGGPAVEQPTRRGFGSRLIMRGLSGTGGVDLSYDRTGLNARFTTLLLHAQQH